MAEEQLIETPDQQETGGTPPPQGPDYTSKVYKTLKDNIQDFDKDETTFRKLLTTDSAYRAKVYKTLVDNIQDFNKKPEEFDSNIGVIHRSPVHDAESTRVKGVPLPQPGAAGAPAPVAPTSGKQGIDTVKGLLEKTGVKTADQVHAEEVAAAQQRISKTWEKAKAGAKNTLLAEKIAAARDQERRSSTQPGYVPQSTLILPQNISDEEVAAYTADPMNQRKLLSGQVSLLKKEGKTKEANQLSADLYAGDTQDIAAGKEEKINRQLKELREGKLRYSPISRTLVEPTDLGQSIGDAWEKRQKDIALFDAADNDSDEELIKKLNHEISKQDPTEPVRVPEGIAGHIGAFIGDQGPVGAVATGVAAIPVVGEAAAAGIYGHEMARRDYAQALVRTYASLKGQGLSDSEALVKAKEDAKRAMLIGGIQGVALGAATGKLGKPVKGVELPAPTGAFRQAVAKAYNFIKEGAPSAVTQAGIADAAQQAKNASAAAAGAPHAEGEGTVEALTQAPLFHYAFGALGKGLHNAPTLMRKVLQGMTKVPEPEIRGIADEMVNNGILTPEQSANAQTQIQEHKALDAQVPDKVKNDEVRLDLQKKIKRRQELEDELKTVNKAFHPEVKEKIKVLDEKMNEIANSPEAKQETPEPETIKPTNNEQATSGERGTLPSTEKQTEPSAGGTESGSPGSSNRPEEVRGEENGAHGGSREKVTFKTSKGSTYEVNNNGTTTRNKSTRAEDKGGLQEPSEKTYYLSKEDMDKLSLVQATHPEENVKYVIGEHPDGKIGVGITGGKDSGKLVKGTVLTPKTEPEVGLHPLEVWKGGREHHFGNEITEVIKPEKNAIQERSPAEVLQREPGETGKSGGERGRMEPSEQGEKLTGESTQPPEKPASEPVSKKKIKTREELTGELKKTGLSDDEKFVLSNSFPEYKKKNPEATQDEYNAARAKAYKKQVELRSSGIAEYGDHETTGTSGKQIKYIKPFSEAKGAVDFVKEHLPDDPRTERILKLVEPHLKDVEVDATRDFATESQSNKVIDPSANGYFLPKGKKSTILINWKQERTPEQVAKTTLHEMVHAATYHSIETNGAFKTELEKILDKARAHSGLPIGNTGDAVIASLYHGAEGVSADKYGLVNVHEMIAEVFSNKNFQNALREIKYKGPGDGKPVNALKRFFIAVAKLLSKNYKALADARAGMSVDNLADYLMQLSENITKEKTGKTASGEGVAEISPGSEEEKQIKGILARTELPDAEVKQALLDAGHDEATVDRLMGEVKDEQTKGPEQLIREAHTQGEAAKKAAKLAPPADTRIAKASIVKTAKRWFYDKQDEVTDVKSIIRTRKGQEEHELDMIYKASNKARDFWNTVPKEKREAFILGMERPDLQKNWTQDEKDMATVYRERLQKTFDVIKSAMPDLNFLEDYFPHFWKKPDEVKNFFASAAAKAPLEGSKGFAMKRSFDNILPGIKKGYDLVTTNPEELVRLAEANAWKFKTARSIFEDMKKLGYLKFSTAKDLPADWKGVEDKLFNRMGAYVTKEGDAQVAKGQYMMPPEVAKLMNDYLSVSGVAAPIKNVVQKYNTIKNTFQLGMGGFHFVTTSVESLINGTTTGIQKISTGKPGNIASGVVDLASTATILPNIIQRVSRGLKARSDYYKGNMTADVMNLIAANAKVGRQKMYSLDTWYNTKKAFNAIKVDKDFSQIPKFLWNGILTIPEAINKPLMEHWVPALKIGGYLKSLESEIASRGNMSPRELQQAREKIWDSMDDRLGQVVYDNVFINKTAKDLAFMTIRSAGWTGGTIRTAFKGVGEIPLSGSRIVRGKGLSQRTADLLAMPLTVGFFGGMFHYLMTGTPPEEMKDYFFPKDGTKNPDGTDRRVTLPSYMKDYLAYGKEPLTTLSHKTSPLLNDITELWANKDFYGEKIFNKEDPIYRQGLDVLKHQAESMLPFSFKGNPKDIPRNTQQKAEQGFGLMEAPKERERSETQNAIMKAYVDQMGGMAGQAKTHAQMEQYIARRHARQYIFNGAEWDDLDEDLKEKANVSDVQKFVREAKMDPYEFYFKHLNKALRQEVFDAMPEDDQEKYKKYLTP